MRGSLVIVALLAGAALQAADEKVRTFTFSKESLDRLPAGWKADHTGQDGAGVWKVVADATAPSRQGYALAQTGASPNRVFNLCVADNTSHADVEVSVRFKANKGEKDQGGGIVWRFADANNYYIARFNPLEDNYRVYKVVAGKRMQLATMEEIKIPAGEWHLLTIKMIGADRLFPRWQENVAGQGRHVPAGGQGRPMDQGRRPDLVRSTHPHRPEIEGSNRVSQPEREASKVAVTVVRMPPRGVKAPTTLSRIGRPEGRNHQPLGAFSS